MMSSTSEHQERQKLRAAVVISVAEPSIWSCHLQQFLYPLSSYHSKCRVIEFGSTWINHLCLWRKVTRLDLIIREINVSGALISACFQGGVIWQEESAEDLSELRSHHLVGNWIVTSQHLLKLWSSVCVCVHTPACVHVSVVAPY